MSDAIVLERVTKRYGDALALDDISLRFPAAALTGFLGPNGAGKTTAFRSILGLTRPQSGTIEVLGMRVGPDTPRIVRSVGAVVEEPGLYRALDAVDNMKVAAHTLGRGHDEIPDLLEFVGLTSVARRRVGGFSKGMRQRLALATAMLGDPEILVLDEPLDGLDPAGQVTLKAQLRRLVEERGKTIVVSSHNLSDVEQLAGHVVVIDRGRVVTAGSLEEVLGTSGGFRVEVSDVEAAVAALRAEGFEATVDGGWIRVGADGGADVSRALARAGLYPSALVPERPTLESIFLDLTGTLGGSR